MQRWLFAAVLVGTVIGAVLSEIFLFRLASPPDAVAAIIAGLWVAMPFLAAAGLATLFRKHTPALVTLLVALLVVSWLGLSMYNASAAEQREAQQQLRDSVQPGEDPHHGPAAKRRVGADLRVSFGWVFSVLLLVVIPPVQVAAVLFPPLIAYAVTALVRRGQPVQEPVGA